MELRSGMMVNDSVRLLEPLGSGGMGSVWIAQHLGLDAQVAVKFMAPELVAHAPILRERFKREASICARLRSVHAVQTFDHGVMSDGSPYIVMELLEGANLGDVIASKGRMTAQEVGVIVSQVGKVLHRAHVLGIVHRDIKPDNIFLADADYDFFVKVLDFGIAKQTRVTQKGAVTQTGAVIGTPEFMSPEQAVGSKDIDYRTDLWSLAVVAYYALTAALPFDTTSKEPLWLQMSSGQHRAPCEIVGDLPAELDVWFDKALAPRAEHRFQSAKAMATTFEAIAAGRGHEIVDELSSVDADAETEIPPSSARPGKYDMFGPDSAPASSDDATVLLARGAADELTMLQGSLADEEDVDALGTVQWQRPPERAAPFADTQRDPIGPDKPSEPPAPRTPSSAPLAVSDIKLDTSEPTPQPKRIRPAMVARSPQQQAFHNGRVQRGRGVPAAVVVVLFFAAGIAALVLLW